MTDASVPPSLLAHRPYLLYLVARVASSLARQMGAVVVGWLIYDLTGSALALGLIGLAQFTPTLLFTFAAGHAVDRFDRRRVAMLCQAAESATAGGLALAFGGGFLTAGEVFAAVGVLGAAAAFESPAMAALLSAVVPRDRLQHAAALSTGAFQVAAISGPALGGLAYAASPALAFAAMAACWLAGCLANAAIGRIETERPPLGRSLSDVFAGVHFVRANRIMLGAISLDLFAVLLGGATALLPIYAKDILHTGPWGLGALRAAPAVGALAMASWLARHPLDRRVGRRLFQAIVAFGAVTLVFAYSTNIWLSGLALAILGAADTISVVIRNSLLQLRTPDEMRGRVSAVTFLFINASNQLGEFESGTAAALLGVVPSVAVGGVGTILVALAWMALFPELRRLERLD